MRCKIIDYGYRKRPERKHYNDAGIDVYSLFTYYVRPHESVKIPLGFGIELPDGYVAFIMPRSSTSFEGMPCELAPIDSGYKGELHAIITNHNDYRIQIDEETAIGQLVILPCILPDLVDDLGDERGTGCFGSTNEKN